ncbi:MULTISPECIES: hypothetical protein [Bradyrhizobium]|uniref:hypothetical protein n=1 Tax=Bradyrhizobium elkanii TaxID=29448 RepID=UPI0012BBC2AE|nr:hypothetical protein [Bradyrhizobium elkanii]
MDWLFRVLRRLGVHFAAVRDALVEEFPLILARPLGAAGGRIADLARRKRLGHQGIAGPRHLDGNRMRLRIACAQDNENGDQADEISPGHHSATHVSYRVRDPVEIWSTVSAFSVQRHVPNEWHINSEITTQRGQVGTAGSRAR